MPETIRCTIVTPEAAVYDASISYASIPAWDGQMGVMSGQSPVLSRLAQGPLRVDEPDGSARRFLVEGGFAQIRSTELTILTERATPAEKLSVEEADAELAEANARVTVSGADRARVEADQQRARSKRALALAARGRT